MKILFNKSIKYKNNKIEKKVKHDKIILKNYSNIYGYFLKGRIFNGDKNYLQIKFTGGVIKGNSILLCIWDTKKNLIGEVTLNSNSIIKLPQNKKFIVAIKILPNTEAYIESVEYEYTNNGEEWINKFGKSDTLVITPSYPSMENKYFSGFVHSRLKAYKEANIEFEVACCYFYSNITEYEFEGIKVVKMSHFDLRKLLQSKKYKRILVHFFDEEYGNIFDSVNLNETSLYFWVHGPETLYKDSPKFLTNYFSKDYDITFNDEKLFKIKDNFIKKYNEKTNVNWIFVSNWIKKRSEELLEISFNNSYVIPNVIDETVFNYIPKSGDQRKKIFFLRRFDNIDKYAIDVNVRTILELSRRKCFCDMEFNIYGTGDFYEPLINPIKNFPNVHLYRNFLTHEEISEIHKKNGIALFATRYDAQGVSMCEAAMSGMVVVASDNEAVKEFLPAKNIYAPTEEYIKYADIIERLYNNEEEFLNLSQECHETVKKICCRKETVEKEIKIFSKKAKEQEIKKIKQNQNPVLSIIIPAYNVANYIESTLITIINHNNASNLDIIVVNDGSKDNTVQKVKNIIEKYCDNDKPIIRLVDKDNGGHGSTINVGLELSKGKYVRIIDGDDWVNSIDLNKLIDILKKENSDIVITNYSEDIAYNNKLVPKDLYSFIKEGITYNFDDLCDEYYGFKVYGPVLATGNFKLDTLKKNNFKLTEKSFYVDMEFNCYSIMSAETITYYNLDVYRYFIGRSNQSISQESFVKNRKQHERILFNVIKIVEESNLNYYKKNYIVRTIIYPMLYSHYLILIEYVKSGKEFKQFDDKLKEHKDVYNLITAKSIVLYRKTKGCFVKYNNFLKKVYKKIRKI